MQNGSLQLSLDNKTLWRSVLQDMENYSDLTWNNILYPLKLNPIIAIH